MDDTIEVAVWLALRESEVLAVRPHDQTLFFLPGGLIEPGESGAEAAAREVGEEVGHRLLPAALREIGAIDAPAVGRPGIRVILRCFTGGALPRVTTCGDADNVENTEIAEIAWIAPSGRAALCSPVLKALETLEEALGRLTGSSDPLDLQRSRRRRIG